MAIAACVPRYGRRLSSRFSSRFRDRAGLTNSDQKHAADAAETITSKYRSLPNQHFLLRRRRKNFLSVLIVTMAAEWKMRTDLTFATGRFPQAIRFVLVNNRVPRADRHCALCGGLVEKGYVRDLRTDDSIYCDAQCFAGWAAASVVKTRGRKAS